MLGVKHHISCEFIYGPKKRKQHKMDKITEKIYNQQSSNTIININAIIPSTNRRQPALRTAQLHRLNTIQNGKLLRRQRTRGPSTCCNCTALRNPGGLWPPAYWGHGFTSRSRHTCLSAIFRGFTTGCSPTYGDLPPACRPSLETGRNLRFLTIL